VCEGRDRTLCGSEQSGGRGRGGERVLNGGGIGKQKKRGGEKRMEHKTNRRQKGRSKQSDTKKRTTRGRTNKMETAQPALLLTKGGLHPRGRRDLERGLMKRQKTLRRCLKIKGTRRRGSGRGKKLIASRKHADGAHP